MPMAIKQELLKLIAVQKIDLSIYELIQQKEKIPVQLDFLKEKEKTAAANLQMAKDAFKKEEMDRKTIEISLEENKGKIQKFESQLFQIKTNEEYSNMLKQIEKAKQELSKEEDDFLLKMEEGDHLVAAVKEAEKIFSMEKDKLKKEEDILSLQLKEIEEKMNGLKQERANLLENINKSILQKYEQILAKRKDCAITPIKDDHCGSCHMVLQPQVIDQAKSSDFLVLCDTCSRILYDEAILGNL